MTVISGVAMLASRIEMHGEVPRLNLVEGNESDELAVGADRVICVRWRHAEAL